MLACVDMFTLAFVLLPTTLHVYICGLNPRFKVVCLLHVHGLLIQFIIDNFSTKWNPYSDDFMIDIFTPMQDRKIGSHFVVWP